MGKWGADWSRNVVPVRRREFGVPCDYWGVELDVAPQRAAPEVWGGGRRAGGKGLSSQPAFGGGWRPGWRRPEERGRRVEAEERQARAGTGGSVGAEKGKPEPL